jgi:hypothetical protein
LQYNAHTISLKDEEEARLSLLEAKGISIIEIFRLGLTLVEEAENHPLTPPKDLIERVKKLVKG